MTATNSATPLGIVRAERVCTTHRAACGCREVELGKVWSNIQEAKKAMANWEFNIAWRKLGEAQDGLAELGYGK